MSTTWNPDLNDSATNSLNVTIPVLAFMDDMIWIADSYDQMTSILNIAQTFYELNSMKVNFDKSYLITDHINTESMLFRCSYNNISFECQTISPMDSTRYLGV